MDEHPSRGFVNDLQDTGPVAGPPVRRRAAQCLFGASGVCAVLFFGGVESWAKTVLAILLGLACLLEATVAEDPPPPVPRLIRALVGSLAAWLLLSLCPWPVSWAGWLAPGQAYLLAGLEGWRPAMLHGTLAPVATWDALGVFLGGMVVLYLGWSWSGERSFRSVMNVMFVGLAVVVGLLGLIDRLDHSDLLYGFRHTRHQDHWGAFINRNHFANYLTMGALVAFGSFLRFAFPRRGQRVSSLLAAGFLGATGFCLVMSMSTGSKGGLLSATAGFGVFAAAFLLRKRFGLRARVIVLAALAFPVLLFIWGRPVLSRIEEWMRAPQIGEADGRRQVWLDSLHMAWVMRGRGIGVGAFETVFPAFQTSQGHKTISHVENEYIQAWAEWGIPGCLPWVTLIGLLGWRAVRTVRQRASEWQIAGWAAVSATAAHAAVDFPWRIPANAWVLLVLIGMLSRHRQDPDEDVAAPGVAAPPRVGFRWGLAILGIVMLALPLSVLSSQARLLRSVEDRLGARDHIHAAKEGRQAMELWPFYWRAHELSAYSEAGLPSKTRDVQQAFRRAQWLSRSNATISYRAGTLFLRAHPAIARDFFEVAMQISDQPLVMLDDVLRFAAKRPEDLAALAPLCLEDIERWLLAWQLIRSNPGLGDLGVWTTEGASRWLGDPERRQRIVEALIEGGEAAAVAEAFKNHPPRSVAEEYWEACARKALGDHETAAKTFQSIWKRHTSSVPSFEKSTEITELTLARTGQEPQNLTLHRQVAETLASEGRHKEAAPYWRQILVLVPEDRRARYGLAVASQALPDWPEAATRWHDLVRMDCSGILKSRP